MEDINYLNDIDILFPENQKDLEENNKIKKEEKNKRKEEYLKNKEIKEIKEAKDNLINGNYMKKKNKKRNKIKQQKIRMNNYQNVKNMTKEEKEKYYDEYFLQKKLSKEKKYQGLIEAYNSNFIICFDLNYNTYMDWKEQKSLISQLSSSYSINKHCKKKINFYFTNMTKEIKERLNKNNAENWKVHYNEKPFFLIDELISLKKEFIYLSPDAEEDLDNVTDDKIYIIGGIVDRNVIKNLSKSRVNNIKNENNEIKIDIKRLPLQKYMKDIGNIVLNINTVVEILSGYMDMDEKEKNWKIVFENTLPKRKLENKK